MPIYEYICNKCNGLIEVMQSFKDTPLEKCQECGGNLNKIISDTSFVLKGTGWYKTDYAKKPLPAKSETKEQITTTKNDSKPKNKTATASTTTN